MRAERRPSGSLPTSKGGAMYPPSIGILDAKLGKVRPKPGEVINLGMGIARPSVLQWMELRALK